MMQSAVSWLGAKQVSGTTAQATGVEDLQGSEYPIPRPVGVSFQLSTALSVASSQNSPPTSANETS